MGLTITELRTELAIALVQQERIPLEAASQLAGLHQPEFERLLASRNTEEFSSDAQEEDAWDILESSVGAVEAPADWSVEHNHYLYGTPKARQNINRNCSTSKPTR